MNKKTIYLLMSILALALIAILSQVNVAQTFARKDSLADKLNLTSGTMQTAKEEDFAYDYSNLVYVGESQENQNYKILEQAKSMVEELDKQYLKEGWLYFSSHTETFPATESFFADGSPIPTAWHSETWVLLGADGNAIKAVSIQDAGDPSTTTISVFEDGIWHNVTLGLISDEPEIYRPGFGGSLINMSERFIGNIKLSQTKDAEKSAIVFTVEDLYKEPVSFVDDDSDQPAIGGVIRYYYSEDSGLPIMTEDLTLYLDGSLRLRQRITEYPPKRDVAPPDHLYDYFKNGGEQ